MDKTHGFLILGIVFFALLINPLGTVISEDYVMPGSESLLIVNVNNYNTDDLENMKVNVYIPDMGFYQSFGVADIKPRDIQGKITYLNIPRWASSGEHLMWVTLTGYHDDKFFQTSRFKRINII